MASLIWGRTRDSFPLEKSGLLRPPNEWPINGAAPGPVNELIRGIIVVGGGGLRGLGELRSGDATPLSVSFTYDCFVYV